jgi:hypothetical protein
MFADLYRNSAEGVRRDRHTDDPILTSHHEPAVERSGNAGGDIVIASLSAREKGFIAGTHGSLNKGAMQELYDHVAAQDGQKIRGWIKEHDLTSAFRKNQFNWLRSLPNQMSPPGGQYEYFDELKQQYKLYRAGQAAGNYQLAEPGNKSSATGQSRIFFAIDGIHSLGTGNPEEDLGEDSQKRQDMSLGRMKSRIHQLKGEETLEDSKLMRWEHPPLLFRLAHHFGNGFFGHARSLPQSTQTLFDQRRNLNKGVIKASGYDIVRELLGLDEELRPTGSRRILIDMGYLSAASRSDLYERIFRIYNKNVDPGHPIPVVFTGAAYSGIDYLIEMVKNAHGGVDGDDFRVSGYYGGSINLADEDILAIFRSNGLIALSLDEYKLGDDLGGIGKIFSNSARSKALRLLGRQISGMVSVPFAYHLPDPLKIWNCLSIGPASKEGMTLQHFSANEDVVALRNDVTEVLDRLKKDEPMWFGGYKPCELAEKICAGNLKEFACANF